MQPKQSKSTVQNQSKNSENGSVTHETDKNQKPNEPKIQSFVPKNIEDNNIKQENVISNQQKKQSKKQQAKQQNKTQVKQQKQQKKYPQNQIYSQLLDMGFQQYLIKQALKITSNKDKAIEYIISSLQNQQKILEKTKQKNKQKQMDIKQKKVKKQGQKQEQGVQGDDDDFQDEDEDYKMVFLVRMDLKMGLGKIAAQVAHATLKAYKQMQAKADKNQIDEVNFFQWMQGGQKKIVVKVNDQKQLIQTIKKAEQKGINSCYIRDAGLTQVASGSMTVGALGPAPSSQIDALTKHFKLL